MKANILILIGGAFIILGLALMLGPLFFNQVDTDPLYDPDAFFLQYRSDNLTDEELAGSLPTELNHRTGTIEQNLGVVEKLDE